MVSTVKNVPSAIVDDMEKHVCRSLSSVQFICLLFPVCWPGYFRQYSDSLWPGRSGHRIQVVARFSVPVQAGPVAHPSFYTMGSGCTLNNCAI